MVIKLCSFCFFISLTFDAFVVEMWKRVVGKVFIAYIFFIPFQSAFFHIFGDTAIKFMLKIYPQVLGCPVDYIIVDHMIPRQGRYLYCLSIFVLCLLSTSLSIRNILNVSLV